MTDDSRRRFLIHIASEFRIFLYPYVEHAWPRGESGKISGGVLCGASLWDGYGLIDGLVQSVVNFYNVPSLA